eukprot:2613294-Pyramimonas_sp.AAC.1
MSLLAEARLLEAAGAPPAPPMLLQSRARVPTRLGISSKSQGVGHICSLQQYVACGEEAIPRPDEQRSEVPWHPGEDGSSGKQLDHPFPGGVCRMRGQMGRIVPPSGPRRPAAPKIYLPDGARWGPGAPPRPHRASRLASVQ